MRKKSIFIIILLLSFSFNIYEVSAINNVNTKIENNASSFISNVKNFIVEHTPSFIKKSVDSAVTLTESFRKGLVNLLRKEKINLTTQIKNQEVEKNSYTKHNWKSTIHILLEKIELFFTNLSFIILNSKIAFYTISILLFILFIRFIWVRIL